MPRHPEFSTTTRSLSASVYSALADRARAKAGRVFPLHVGDTYRDPVFSARSESQRTSEHARLHNYAPVLGEPELVRAIVERLSPHANVQPDCLQVMVGATAGLSVVCQTLLDPGDEVLLLAPFWPLIRGIIASRGATPVQVPFYTRVAEPGFDPEALIERAVTARTTALYINSPNNPTGVVLSRSIVDALVRVAKRHDLWILWDEAYEDLWHEAPSPREWARTDVRDRSIVSHTFSKSFGMAGTRVGYVHGPHAVMQAVRGVQAFQTYCAPRPMQFAALAALRDGAGWLTEARDAYRAAARAAAEVVGMAPPAGGTFLFFDTTPFWRAGENLQAFLERCADAGVLLTPGPSCGEHFRAWARLCFTAVPPDELADGLARLAPVLSSRV